MSSLFFRFWGIQFVRQNNMGIHGLSKVIADHAPAAIKEQDIKNYFGNHYKYLSLHILG